MVFSSILLFKCLQKAGMEKLELGNMCRDWLRVSIKFVKWFTWVPTLIQCPKVWYDFFVLIMSSNVSYFYGSHFSFWLVIFFVHLIQTKDLKGMSIDLLVPGMMVNARVKSILENGVMLSFLTYFTGTVSASRHCISGNS
jgi:hypothetical protein